MTSIQNAVATNESKAVQGTEKKTMQHQRQSCLVWKNTPC